MPNRIIKESICTSDSVDRLSWFEEVLFYRLIVNCDDFGRYDGRPAIVKNRLFPLKELLSIYEVSTALVNLENAELITMYEHDGRPYLQLNTWEDHQTIRAKKSKYPAPPEINWNHVNTIENNYNQLNADVHVIQSNPIQSESKKEGVKQKRFTPPSLEEVKEYCESRNNGVDPQAFIDFYTSKGWKIGKETMKDWQAAVRTWERREEKQPQKKKQFTTAEKYEPPHKTIDVDAFNKLNEMFGGINEIQPE